MIVKIRVMALYPVDRGLSRWLPECPTTELMICRRR
jgi:hypothetical protein